MSRPAAQLTDTDNSLEAGHLHTSGTSAAGLFFREPSICAGIPESGLLICITTQNAMSTSTV